MSGPVLFSASAAFYLTAVQELRRNLQVASVTQVGVDAGIVELEHGGLAEVFGAVERSDLRFVKHLAGVVGELPTKVLVGDAGEAVADLVFGDLERGEAVALQVWESGKTAASPEDVWQAVADALNALGIGVRRSGCPKVVSVCLGEHRSAVGLNASALAVSDWPGGRVRLAASREQVSRAEFKLEELYGLYPVPAGTVGLDLGAGLGGWSRILRKHGYETVHAVDVAEPAPAVAADPGVVHHPLTPVEFLDGTAEWFDLVVSDMRLAPELSAQLMLDAAHRLRPRGTAVVTLKLEESGAVDQADRALGVLRRAYEIVFARQLQHNRNELTVVGRLPK